MFGLWPRWRFVRGTLGAVLGVAQIEGIIPDVTSVGFLAQFSPFPLAKKENLDILSEFTIMCQERFSLQPAWSQSPIFKG